MPNKFTKIITQINYQISMKMFFFGSLGLKYHIILFRSYRLEAQKAFFFSHEMSFGLKEFIVYSSLSPKYIPNLR